MIVEMMASAFSRKSSSFGTAVAVFLIVLSSVVKGKYDLCIYCA